MIKLFYGLVLFYFLSMLMMYVMQRNFIYFPDKSQPVVPDGVVVADVTTSDGLRIRGWYVAGRDSTKPVIVLFHGNAGHYGHRVYKANYYINEGYGILLTGYRGYGGNQGKPTEEGFYSDGRAYMEWLREREPERDIIVYGESIGSGTATQMAMEYDVMALVLETPFASLADAAASHYPVFPVHFLIKDRFDNKDKIARIDAPVLILHGHLDSVIPYSSAQRLYNSAVEPKRFIDFPQGNHNDLHLFGVQNEILNFLSGVISQNK